MTHTLRVVTSLIVLFAGGTFAAERSVKIAGFGTKSGVFKSFGTNSEAVLNAAVAELNAQGGIKLADGSKAKIETTFLDDRCTPEEGISVVRRLASEDWLLAIGPGCSNVCESVYGILQKKVDDPNDSGLQFPIFTDTAIKGGLAKISEWAFRNTPSEPAMYEALFKWVHEKHPEIKKLYGGVEENFLHSNVGWYKVMKDQATKTGFEVLGEQKWLLDDTSFTAQVREWKKAAPDAIAISAHPFTMCGVLREMKRQHVKPKLVIGLTSSSTLETLSGCSAEAEATGIIIPTSFAPITKGAKHVADVTEKYKGHADLHSAAVWENVIALKTVLDNAGIEAKPDTVQKDRRRIRDALAKLTEIDGLLGKVARTPERESVKPFVLVQPKHKAWDVVYDPRK